MRALPLRAGLAAAFALVAAGATVAAPYCSKDARGRRTCYDPGASHFSPFPQPTSRPARCFSKAECEMLTALEKAKAQQPREPAKPSAGAAPATPPR